MNTDDWIGLLARSAGPAPAPPVAARLLPVLAVGALAAAALALAVLGPIPAALFGTAAPWLKLGYALALATAGTWGLWRLARPLPRWQGPAAVLALVVAAMGLLALASGWATPADQRLRGLWGHSWATCPVSVLGLSLPTLAGLLWALRGLAPTRLHLAGLAAGLVAGAVGAFGYAFACVETAPMFIALWYSLGIALAGALGAVLGPRCLRW